MVSIVKGSDRYKACDEVSEVLESLIDPSEDAEMVN